MSTENFADRLRLLQGDASLRSYALRIGVGYGAIRAIYGGAKPTLDTLIALARGSKVNLEWLATGEGPMRPSESTALVPANANFSAEIVNELVLIRRLDVKASAGGGVVALEMADDGLDFVAFKAAWLRARGINPEFVHLIVARGDSMEPTLRNGDLLLVDTSIDRVRDNSLYVIVFDGLVFVKRIHKRMTGAVVLISDNERYPAEEIPAQELPNLHIAGRVVWYGRDI